MDRFLVDCIRLIRHDLPRREPDAEEAATTETTATRCSRHGSLASVVRRVRLRRISAEQESISPGSAPRNRWLHSMRRNPRDTTLPSAHIADKDALFYENTLNATISPSISGTHFVIQSILPGVESVHSPSHEIDLRRSPRYEHSRNVESYVFTHVFPSAPSAVQSIDGDPSRLNILAESRSIFSSSTSRIKITRTRR